MTNPAKHITVSISRPFEVVYAFASNPENAPKWASGLSGSIHKEELYWISQSPLGKVKVVFAEKNKFGVIDHDVTLESGQTFHNPFRILKNAQGCEAVFTLFRLPNVSDEEFNRDADTVLKDLKTLKALMESH